MNKILYNKVKRTLKSSNEEKIKNIIYEIQKKFAINKNSNVFEIENKITDQAYANILKKYQ